MTTFYYRITAPGRLACLDAHRAQRKALAEKCEAFAREFLQPGQLFKVLYHTHVISFAGLAFDPPMPVDTWFIPAGPHGMQRPRVKPAGKGITAEQKAAHADLLKRWAAAPKDKVDVGSMFEALIGIPNDFFTKATVHKGVDGALWVSSSRQAKPELAGVTEVLASDYDQAVKAAEKKGEPS